MYRAGSDETIQFLVGRTLDLVCFASHQIYLHLSEECRIDVECVLVYNSKEGKLNNPEPAAADRTAVLAALEQCVESANFLENSELLLNFGDGSNLTLFPESNFESYRIHGNGKSILI